MQQDTIAESIIIKVKSFGQNNTLDFSITHP